MNPHSNKRILLLLLLFFTIKIVSFSQPCMPGWNYRVPIKIAYEGWQDESNVQLLLHGVNTLSLINNNKMKADGSDIRFTNASGLLLDYYIEKNTIYTTNTKIWIKTDLLKKRDTTVLYMYYGNPIAFSYSNPERTFLFFDDFNNLSNWQHCGSGIVNVLNGNATFSNGNLTSDKSVLTTKQSFIFPCISEMQVESALGDTTMNIYIAQHYSNYNGYGLVYKIEKKKELMEIGRFFNSSSCFLHTTSLGDAGLSEGLNGQWRFSWFANNGQWGEHADAKPQGIASDYILPAQLYTSFGIFNGSGTLAVDWFRVRKYIPYSPVVSVGTEIKMAFPGNLNIGNNSPLCEGQLLQLWSDSIPGAMYFWSKPDNSIFSTKVNPSAISITNINDSGIYKLKVIIPGSLCDTVILSTRVVIYPQTQAGYLDTMQHVCMGVNNKTLSLLNSTGSVIRWEYTHTGAEPWTQINNPTTQLTFKNIVQSTSYRAIVKSGSCSEKISPVAKIIVDPISQGGNFANAYSLCEGNNVLDINLLNYTGTILNWIKTTDSINWSSVGVTNVTLHLQNMNETTWFKTIVKSGTCVEDTSVAVKVKAYQPTLGGSFIGKTVCSGLNFGEIQLLSYRGKILNWEVSETGGNPWTTINSTSDKIEFDNLTKSLWYRAVVQNEACSKEYSVIDTIVVDKPVVKGFVDGSTNVCTGLNNGLLTLKEYSGITTKWQSSFDGSSWKDIASHNDSMVYSSINEKTYFRTEQRSQYDICPRKFSDSAIIQVTPLSIGGSVTGSALVCGTKNNGLLKLNASVGNVVRWEQSASGKEPWYNISNTTDSLKYIDLPVSTFFRAVVKSGVCPDSASDVAIVNATSPSIGGIITGNASVCEGNNQGTLMLANYSGMPQLWQRSNNQKIWFTAVSDEPDKLMYKDIVDTTYYRVIVKNGICPVDTSGIAYITVFPKPIVDFISDTALEGNASHFTNKSTISVGSIVSYDWDFGNGYSSTAKNPVYIYPQAGTFQVTLKVRSYKGCMDSITKDVIVFPKPKVDFSFSDVCLKDSIYFVNKTTIQSGDLLYKWNLGDGTVLFEKNVVHHYAKAGSYVVTLFVTSEKLTKDSIQKKIVVYPQSTPDFVFKNACSGQNIIFTNTSYISSGSLSYLWDLGNGTFTTALNPQNSYPNSGDYKVKLFTTSDKDCKDTIHKIIRIHPNPIAKFYTLNVPYNVSSDFTDSSTIKFGKLKLWNWSFGDGTTSQLQHPQHLYASPGTYLVNLSVVSDSGCSNSVSKNISIYSLPVAQFSFVNVCNKQIMQFTNTSSIAAGKLFYTWYFGDGDSTTQEHPVHLYKNAGKYNVALFILSDAGAKDTVVKEITVYPLPHASFDVLPVCDGFPSVFKNKSQIDSGNKISFTWDFGDGTNSIQQHPVKQFLNSGTYSVVLNVLSDKGCSHSIQQNVVVQDLPVADFIVENVCFGYPVTIQNYSQLKIGKLNYQFNMGDGTELITTNPVYKYKNPGKYRIRLLAFSENNCKDSLVRYVQVYELPRADAGMDTSTSKGFPVTIQARGGVKYDWLPGNSLDNSSVSRTIARPFETTDYVVRVENEYGCVNYDTVKVTVNNDYKIIPANIITPDGNGINDTWKINNIDFYNEATIFIYNRWGKEVFYKKGYENNWDGRNSNGDILPDGTYYYLIRFEGTDKHYKGAITILRNKN